FFSSRRRHTRFSRDWSSDVCSSDLLAGVHEQREHPAITPQQQAAIWREVAQRLITQRVDDRQMGGVERFPRVEENGVVAFRDWRSEERRVGKERISGLTRCR